MVGCVRGAFSRGALCLKYFQVVWQIASSYRTHLVGTFSWKSFHSMPQHHACRSGTSSQQPGVYRLSDAYHASKTVEDDSVVESTLSLETKHLYKLE